MDSNFKLGKEDKAKVAAWSAEQDQIIYNKQKKSKDNITKDMANMIGGAYYGACGGELTYCFTPTSIGMILVVKHAGTGAELNLTDYENW